MNSEELELSLRAEFENYLNGVFGRLRQDVAEFQKSFEAEFAKHKAQVDEAIRDLGSRFEDPRFDRAFTESVTEHLRLARDEGAKLTATAMGEAAKLGSGTPETPERSGYDQLRDAVNDIGSKTSQSAILRSLVEHASAYTPRGAFFIVRNDRFICWKVFGGGRNLEAAAPDIQFPVSSDTLLADSAGSLATREAAFGKYSDDVRFLEPLDFGRPDRMYAVPLMARGRGVAVLYADYGTDGTGINIEAIETLVRVAGLTVELLAASQTARIQPAAATEPAPTGPVPEQAARDGAQPQEQTGFEFNTAALSPETLRQAEDVREYTGSVAVNEAGPQRASGSFDSEAEADTAYGEQSSREQETAYGELTVDKQAATEAPAIEQHQTPEEAAKPEPTASDFAFATSDTYEPQPEPSTEAKPAEEASYEFAGTNGKAHAFQPTPTTVVETAVKSEPSRSRFSSRNMDLPIEVSEDERRFHNDARRFARLLISEIKLYNEQQVNEARESGDIYGRLREAIDRSREMYESRVRPEVASKFDYFHYELVNGLADGNAAKLGVSYPGAAV